MVIPRCFSSGALPWSMWPMVPMLTCGLVRSNFAFATVCPPRTVLVRTPCSGSVFRPVRAGAVQLPQRVGFRLCACRLGDDLLRHVARNFGVGVELHGVARPALGLRPQ